LENKCSICLHLKSPSSFKIFEFSDAILYLNEDQFFRGYAILEYKEHVKELFDLSGEARGLLMGHLCQAAKALQKVFSPDKINYELLGNKVPHLHWHIVPRFKSDPAWPEPIWRFSYEPKKIADKEAGEWISRIKSRL
jgi:diadenosine tetraphosphate (Ap4A) HIT family hydrolase